MPTAIFKTTSSAPSVPSRGKATEAVVAEVAAYLAYADQTDMFGYHGSVESVTVAPSNDQVTIEWRAPVASEQDIQQVTDEMNRLGHVITHECVSNPTNPKI